MAPTLHPGKLVFIWRWGYKPRVNDIVIIKHNGLEKIKRITRIEPQGLYVRGDNALASTDSRHFGIVPFESVMGKAIGIF